MKKTGHETTRAVRKAIKNNILNSSELVRHEEERKQVSELLRQTIQAGESNSALLIGPPGSGKTTLVNQVLDDLGSHLQSEAVLVRLHGLIHTDDRLGLRSFTSQLNLENAVDGKVFGSFADNLAFLLACLKSGERETSKSIIVVIEDFDLFCSHRNQTLLYNLFDVSQSAQTPVCVLGITCRFDVIELLEKRVKSRFSHRQVFLFPGTETSQSDLDERLTRVRHLLSILNDQKAIPVLYRKQWNAHVGLLVGDRRFKKLMQRLLDIDVGERCLKNVLLVVVSRLDDGTERLTCEMFAEQIQRLESDETVQVLLDLSVLELSLIITMKHHCEIYDNQPMNFEMLLNRYVKFANTNSGVQGAERPVVMKAFEQLQNLELISMLGTSNSGVQKEYQLFKLLVLPHQISEVVKNYLGLPTEVVQYANSCFI